MILYGFLKDSFGLPIKDIANNANKDPNKFRIILLTYPGLVDSKSQPTNEGQRFSLTGTIDQVGNDVVNWLTAPYGDSHDAPFFCGAGLRQFTGIGAYGCGNGPEGGQVYPWGIAFGGEFPVGIPRHWAFSGCGLGFSGCGGFGGWDD